jgi:hypothetical protein
MVGVSYPLLASAEQASNSTFTAGKKSLTAMTGAAL